MVNSRSDLKIRLRSCPFCNEDDAVIQERDKHKEFPYRVKCLSCGAKSGDFRTIDAAVKHWNNWGGTVWEQDI